MLLFIGYKQKMDLDVYTYTVAAFGLSAIYYFVRNKYLRTAHLTLFRLDCELLGTVFRTSSQIIHTRFQSFRPCVKMHRRERIVVRVFLPQVQTLALTDEGPSVGGHINHMTHWDLPNRLVL